MWFVNVVFTQSSKKMCKTCSFGQVELVTPMTNEEFDQMVTASNSKCPECRAAAFNICEFKFPSLILNWSLKPKDNTTNNKGGRVHEGRMIV